MDPKGCVNVILSNFLDKDVHAIFLPLYLMQMLTLSPMYQVKNNFINPNERLNIFISICGLVMFIGLNLYRISEMLLDDNLQRYQTVNFLYFATMFNSLFYASGNIMNFVLHLIHTKDYVKFILTYQKVHRFINNNTVSLKSVIIRNWFSVIIICLFHVCTSVYVYIVYMHPPWYVIGYVVILLTNDTSVVNAISLIKLLTEKVELWNTNVKLSLSNGHCIMCCKNMIRAYVHILDCYKIYKKSFQLPVLFHTTEVFLLGLVKVQILIDFLHFHSKNVESGVTIVQGLLYVLLLKCLTFQFLLSYNNEAFHIAMKNCHDSCALVLASNCTDEEKKLCKNIKRVHRASYSPMSACGLFRVDISHQLRVLALLTNYTVVLLQFALL